MGAASRRRLPSRVTSRITGGHLDRFTADRAEEVTALLCKPVRLGRFRRRRYWTFTREEGGGSQPLLGRGAYRVATLAPPVLFG